MDKLEMVHKGPSKEICAEGENSRARKVKDGQEHMVQFYPFDKGESQGEAQRYSKIRGQHV